MEQLDRKEAKTDLFFRGKYETMVETVSLHLSHFLVYSVKASTYFDKEMFAFAGKFLF